MCCRYWADESPEFRAIVEEMNRSALVGRWQENLTEQMKITLEQMKTTLV